MQNKVLNEVAIEQMDDLIKAVKNGSSGFDKDGTLPELQDGEVTDPLMAVGNDGKAKKLPVKTLFGKHNIRGSGNIDLYKHHINLNIVGKNLSGDLYIDIISSNSLNCDSLTDIKTLLGQTFTVNCFGSILKEATTNIVGSFATETAIILADSYNISWSEITTITDTVTTI